MTRQQINTINLAEKINIIADNIALATMAIDGWEAVGERNEGVSGLGRLLDGAINELQEIAEIIHPRAKEQKHAGA